MSVRRSMRLSSSLAFAHARDAARADSFDDVTIDSPLSTRQRVRVVVRAPVEADHAAIYFSGSLRELGNWRAGAIRLSRQPDGSFAGDLLLALGARIEFKLTRHADWATVEKTAGGGERANRAETIESTTHEIECVVERWADR